MEWYQWFIGVGLVAVGAFVVKVYKPFIEMMMSRSASARDDRKETEDQRIRFEKTQQDRIDSLVKQLGDKDSVIEKKDALLLMATEKAASSIAREESIKVNLTTAMDRIEQVVLANRRLFEQQLEVLKTVHTTVNSHSDKQDALIESLTAQVQRLEEAAAKIVNPKNGHQ